MQGLQFSLWGECTLLHYMQPALIHKTSACIAQAAGEVKAQVTHCRVVMHHNAHVHRQTSNLVVGRFSPATCGKTFNMRL